MSEKIAVLIPVKSKPEYKNKFVLSDLYVYFCKSFFKYYSSDHSYTIYLGYQDDDKLYSDKQEQENISRFINTMKNTKVIMIPFNNSYNGNVVAVWNDLFKISADDNEYFIQCGSDILFNDSNFINEAINKLKNNKGFGVVGLQDRGRLKFNSDDKLLTQSIVTKHHLSIFGFYFPPELKNWGCDDWMTEIYEPHSWVLRLRQGFFNMGGKPRYQIDTNYKKIKDNCLIKYKNNISNFYNFDLFVNNNNCK